MLFLTVYGPELESLFLYIHKYTQTWGSVSREQIYSAYLPHLSSSSRGQVKNLDDAINYLKNIGLIEGDKVYSSLTATQYLDAVPFAILLLRQFRHLEQTALRLSQIDLLYVTLLDRLFISPNKTWISDVHLEANQLELARRIGGVSQEKINAWKRVMEFLGIGYRIGGGFYCLYQVELLDILLRIWEPTEETLQDFFEGHLQSWIPCITARGDIAQPVAPALQCLVSRGRIQMFPKQDSPSKHYFGTQRLRGISVL